MAKGKKINWTALFHAEPDGAKLVALAGDVALAHNLSFGESVAPIFVLLDQKTKKPTGQSLFVGMSPASAMRLAKLIQKHAKERGWPELPESSATRTEVPPKKTTH